MLHDTSGTFKYYIKVWLWFCCWFSDRAVILDLILSCDISYTILGGLIFLDQGIYIHWPKSKCIYFIFSELFIVACPEILFLLGCRLFPLNTDTSPKMFCLQINSLWQNIFPQLTSLIGHGQVGWHRDLCWVCFVPFFLVLVSHNLLFFPLFLLCSCILFVWSIPNHCDNQRRTSQFSPFNHPTLCSIGWYICFNRFVSNSYSFKTLLISWIQNVKLEPLMTIKHCKI